MAATCWVGHNITALFWLGESLLQPINTAEDVFSPVTPVEQTIIKTTMSHKKITTRGFTTSPLWVFIVIIANTVCYSACTAFRTEDDILRTAVENGFHGLCIFLFEILAFARCLFVTALALTRFFLALYSSIQAHDRVEFTTVLCHFLFFYLGEMAASFLLRSLNSWVRLKAFNETLYIFFQKLIFKPETLDWEQ